MSENDSCEYFWITELQQLLSMIHQLESECTDIDCLDPGQRLESNSEHTNIILLTGILVVVGFVLYFINPNIQDETIKKLPPGESGNNGSDDLPPPGPMGIQ